MLQDGDEEDRRTWRYEPITQSLVYGCAIREALYTGQTRYQRVELLETESFGRCLVLDGKIQSAEADEFVYHESLVHPALVAHPRPETVCIAGGGEGATAREVLRHSTVKRVSMVDLDQELVEICRQHLPGHHQGAFDDPRLRLHFADARAFLLGCPDCFDVLILDLPDPTRDSPTTLLYTLAFYQMLRSRLKPGGILVTQAGPATLLNHGEVFTAIHHTLQRVFPEVVPYTVPVESFGETWGFVLASLGPTPLDLTPKQVDSYLQCAGVEGLRLYDGIAHQGLFGLPLFLRQALEAESRVITEEHPVFVY